MLTILLHSKNIEFIAYKNNTMKTILTLLTAVLFASTLLSQIPNGGFENWTEGEPDEWTTSNVGAIATITQTEISH